jgi:hypothetical protein
MSMRVDLMRKRCVNALPNVVGLLRFNSSHMKYGHLDRVVLDEVKLTPPPSLCSMIKHESEGGYQRRPRKTIHSNVGIKPEKWESNAHHIPNHLVC